MAEYWQTENFEVRNMLADGDRVALFRTFSYRSKTLGQAVTSPFSCLIRVAGGKVTYLQFLEDTDATAASFRSSGTWTVHNDPGGGTFTV